MMLQIRMAAITLPVGPEEAMIHDLQKRTYWHSDSLVALTHPFCRSRLCTGLMIEQTCLSDVSGRQGMTWRISASRGTNIPQF